MPDPSVARLEAVLTRLDDLNRADPNTDLTEDGQPRPHELLYAQRVSDWVRRLNTRPSAALQIAARGQHVQRWTIPRSRYEMNRQGYLKWRETLKTFHIETVTRIMREAGYGDEDIQKVERIMSKRHLREDPDSQTLEDALCLVFLQTEFADLLKKTDPAKMRDIVRKTWEKMSEQGRAKALSIPLPDNERAILRESVG